MCSKLDHSRSQIAHFIRGQARAPHTANSRRASCFVSDLQEPTPAHDADPRIDRYLSCQDIQTLRTQLELSEIRLPGWASWSRAVQRVERYLPWLEEDAELSQQVVDAWNEIVQSREVSEVKCPCQRCESI